ncbi:hypothetical protein LC653_42795 [Nostoc sp. CHAB 5784]|uniref:hypothetical protein n=1 Tax=Nostoc mirabile TaxID=2907820 RepID=UPI001E2855A4|nr:hypothetical protein [Nostoc mirabile]MCC5670339.1 hypothetical protein [Nostoc mirabile CHAB5784]
MQLYAVYLACACLKNLDQPFYYSKDWKQIATAVKDASNWRCSRCNRLCLRPGENPSELSKSQRRVYNLQVHHYDFDPSDSGEAIFHLGNYPCFNQMVHEYIDA